jgi:hypothetical protein
VLKLVLATMALIFPCRHQKNGFRSLLVMLFKSGMTVSPIVR